MSQSIKPVRGMNDVYGEASHYWDRLETATHEVLGAYGYQQIRLPIVERTELFKRSIGDATDVVQKEMYTFDSRSGTSLTLRPEATASCVRACISNGLLHNQKQRLWYSGPMFRYERPQKGRYRQFHQIGAECFGFAGPDVDAELIFLSARLWQTLGLKNLKLQINSLGTPESRLIYRDRLLEYFHEHKSALDPDSIKRLEINPMRILDSKNRDMQEMIAAAPSITDHLDAQSAEHFEQFRQLLDDAGIACNVNPRLVRGLDYYTRTVFEWETDQLGAQAAVCSGGRYDGLVEQLGGRATPAAGWALGIERLVELMQLADSPINARTPAVYVVMSGAGATRAGMKLSEQLRNRLPNRQIVTHCGGGSFKSQLRAADRSGADLAVILGESEVQAGQAAIKPLRSDDPQSSCSWEDLPERVAAILT